MRSSAQWHIEGDLLDVSEVPWDVLMSDGEGALSEALRVRHAQLDSAAAGADVVGTTSLFANYAAPG